MHLDWKASQPLTVGVEWELQILDRETLQPKDIFEEVYNDLPEGIKPFIHKEVYKSMLEIVTPPSEDEKGVVSLLGEIIDVLRPVAVKRKFHLVGLGTLFLRNDRPTEINVSERYKRFAAEFQEILRDFYIYGIHIHIGLPNEEWALRTFNNLVFFAPLLLALSANSVFYRGKDTGIHSYRMVVFENLPRAQLPRAFSSYGEFKRVVYDLKKFGVIEALKDLWWHIRLRPDYGTVEVRVFDSIHDLKRLELLVKWVRAIALYSEKYQEEPLPLEFQIQNWWWAKRYSLDADFIDGNNRRALKQLAYDFIYKLDHLGVLKRLGYRPEEFTAFLRKPALAKDIALKAKALGLERVVKMAAVV